MDERQDTTADTVVPDAVDADPEWAEYQAWVDAEMAAGRGPEPQAWDPDPAEENPYADRIRAGFGQGDGADVLPPSPRLVRLTDEAIRDLGRLSDTELIGVLQATRRQIAHEQFKQVLTVAEFGRRRQAAFEDALRRGVPAGCRPGSFPGEELAVELVTTRAEAGHRIDDALDLTTRLPATLAGMAAGSIDEERAGWIAMYTRGLTDTDAAFADQVLAADAPDLRSDQLARRAAALEKKLAPEAVEERKARQKRAAQRVEARRELSGNGALSGREMDTADVIASKSYIDALALRLRAGGLPGPLGSLRVLVMADLTQGRDPLDRLNPGHAAGPETADQAPAPAGLDPDTDPDPDPWPGWDAGDNEAADQATRSTPAPMPAHINLTIPVGTLLGWSTAPAEAGPWGLLGPAETRVIAAAAAKHPATRWCLTLTAPDGTAIAHSCIPGTHHTLLDDLGDLPAQSSSAHRPPARLAELLRRLSPAFTVIARDTCDHAQAEPRYTPSRKLKHLIRARTAVCDAPGCDAQATHADLDHTIPWPAGQTDQCNLSPRCRTHHRAKQAPDWNAEQTTPGVTRWTLPSGRTHTTTPTRYDS